MSVNILITICARGGSKGVPGKNIKLLNGIPLFHYTLKIAQKFALLYSADIQVSTDSSDILTSANELGYETEYVRPAKLATDTAGKIAAIADALNYAESYFGRKYEFILDLDVTSPLRTINDLVNAYEKISKNNSALNIFSVSPSSRNPYFNMVEEAGNGYVKVVKDSQGFKSRQEVPKVYDMNASFYIFRRKYFEEGHEISTTNLSMAYVMDHVCFDIDHAQDFMFMELLLQNNLFEFKL